VFRHVVLFRWVEGTTADDIAAVAADLSRLPAAIPELRHYWFGSDAGQSDGNWDFAVVAEFDDADGWRAYRDNAEHQRIIADRIRPLVAERAAVQSSGHGSPG
jgi:hypothetical protein